MRLSGRLLFIVFLLRSGAFLHGSAPPTDPPSLGWRLNASNILQLTWPAIANGVVLQSRSNLDSGQSWSTISPLVTENGDAAIVNIAATNDFQFYRLRSGPSLTDFWNGNAEWVPDAEGIGKSFGFHALSIIRGNDALWAYYITNYFNSNGLAEAAVGRASSFDGIHWTNDGLALDVSGSAPWVYPSATQLFHATGRKENDGWSATPGTEQPNFLVYGPYATNISSGENSAKFRLLIDQHNGGSDTVLRLEVVSGSQTLAARQIARTDFLADNTYQDFVLFFSSQPGQTLEFRTYWYGTAYIKQAEVAVAPGHWAFWDDRIASFCRVYYENNLYYLVYEGAGQDIPNFPGDIGLATSSDGLHFTKSPANPILRHGSHQWEAGNIGTPSLTRLNGVWYLFYHGFDGSQQANIGVATGTNLLNLTKYSGNPVVRSGSGSWNTGAVGIRSTIYKESNYYYFAFEGSTFPPFDTAKWSSGFARSTNLLEWNIFTNNPIIPQTSSSYGYDAPELVRIYGTWFLYVRVSFDPAAPTMRFRLAPK